MQVLPEGADQMDGGKCALGGGNNWGTGWVVTVRPAWGTHSRGFHFAGGGQV